MKATLAITLACLALQAGAARAQVVPGNAMPEALKGIRQASSACMREDDTPGGAAAVAEPAPDLQCAVPAETVQQLLRQPGSVAIDMRSAADFEAYHIDGAVNASLADLLAKPYWRGRKVVLAGSGKGERELYTACARLKQAGYKNVAVLSGGMTSWLAAGKPVRGRAPSAQQLARLSAAELWQEGQFSENLVVMDKDREALLNHIPFSVPVAESSAAAIRRLMDERRRALKGTPAAAVVLVTGADMPDQRVQQLQQSLAPQPVLVYTDTREAFARQVSTQKAIWLAHANGPKRPACGQ